MIDRMEAVPRMPMIWLELKEAGDFRFTPKAVQYIKRHYGENPENYSEALRKLEKLRQHVVNIPRDFEACIALRKYFGQLHFLQSRIPMAQGQKAAVPVTWIDIFSGKQITHEDINYEQACVLYNLGALHSYLGAMDNRVSEEGMKMSCTHFQCAAGAFTYIRDHYNSGYSSDLSHQALSINISLMLAQAQECLLEKALLVNKKSLLIARISAQVCDYYRECIRVLESADSVSGKKDWRKLLCMKITYFSAIKHLHMGKESEEQKKYGEAVAYFQISLGKLNEAIKQSKCQPDSVQKALNFSMDVIGGKFNSAKKDNDFIYHESVPGLDTLPAVKGASLVKPLPVNPTDPDTTGPDLFSKLVPIAAHEASSVYSEEKAKLLRDVMARIEKKNQILESFMSSLNCDSVDLDAFSSVPSALLEKCAALRVQPDAVKRLVQAMQALSGVYTDVGAYLEEVRKTLEEDETGEKTPRSVVGDKGLPPRPLELTELQNEFRAYECAHQAASQTNTELHTAISQHIPNLRLLQGPLDELSKSLPQPEMSQDDTSSLQTMKRICAKVDEMRKQRMSFEKELRDLIQKDDITVTLVTTERSEIKALIEEHLKKYDQLTGYIDQNLAAQDNIIKALTEVNLHCATIRKTLNVTQQQRNSSVQSLLASYEAYEDLVTKAEEGKSFYQDLEKKTSGLLDKVKTICQRRAEEGTALSESEVATVPPPLPSAQKPVLDDKAPGPPSGSSSMQVSVSSFNLGQVVPQNLHGPIPPDVALPRGLPLTIVPHGPAPFTWPPYGPASGVPQPIAPIPSFFVQQPGPSRGSTPVPPQINPQNTSMPQQGYVPAPWQNSPSVSFPEMGQSAARPGLPGHAQQLTPGTQYQGYPPQPGPGMVFFGQFQPPVPPQNQSQPVPPAAYWSTFGAPIQSQPGLPVQPGLFSVSQVSLPGESKAQQIPPGLLSQFHQGQSTQPQGHVLPPIPSTQPQQMLGSLQNPNNQTTLAQTTTQVPFSQNLPTSFPYHSSDTVQRNALPQGNVYFQGGAPPGQAQPVPGSNVCQQPPTQASTMFPTGNPLQPQNTPPQNNPSSGASTGSMMDDPNPPTLAGILTPSPAQPFQAGPSSSEKDQGSMNLDFLQNQLDKLGIVSQGQASDCGEDKNEM